MPQLNTNYDLNILDRAVKGQQLKRGMMENKLMSSKIESLPEEMDYLKKSREQSLEKGDLDIEKTKSDMDFEQKLRPIKTELLGRDFASKAGQYITPQNYNASIKHIKETLGNIGMSLQMPDTAQEINAMAMEQNKNPATFFKEFIDSNLKTNADRMAELKQNIDYMTAEAKLAKAKKEDLPKKTATQKEYEQAKEEGFKGTLLDYKKTIARAGSSSENKSYTPQQLVDDTRGYYSLKMKTLLDEDGYIKKGMEDEYRALTDQLDNDLKTIGKGKQPSWLTGGKNDTSPPPGYKLDPNGRKVNGKPAYISPDGKSIWTAP